MVEQFPSHLSYLDRSQQRGPHGGHNHCNGQTSSQLFVNDILTELKCLDNSIPLFCCTLIPWHNWLKAQYPDTLIGASIPQYSDLIGAKCMSKIPYRYDPFGERYIRYCCDLIGARYLPVKQKFCKGGLNQWQGSITTRGFRGSEPRGLCTRGDLDRSIRILRDTGINSAQPHTSWWIQFLDKENNAENNQLALGLGDTYIFPWRRNE